MAATVGIGRPAQQETVGWVPPEISVIVPTYNERENIAPLYHKLSRALAGTAWEMIVVDDSSPDGTAAAARDLAQSFPNVRCIHRIGRRGLSSACIEGVQASAAPYFGVIDADHQHDETILPLMLKRVRDGDDIAIGSRYAGGGSAGEGLSAHREAGSRLATRLAAMLTGTTVTDPMSGYFLMRREAFDEVAPRLSREGFKILLDIIVSTTRAFGRTGRIIRLSEVPYAFRPRFAGESKMSPLIVVQFLGLLVSKVLGGVVPASFLLFAMVGGSGIVVHMAVLWLTHEQLGFSFPVAQLSATLVAMTTNFVLNNELTYADKRLKGRKFWLGLLSFYFVCSIGTLANVSIASWIYLADPNLYVAGFLGALMSMVFNYSVTRVFTWR
jgi:dolichol-phosphate mannosyltransferase